MTSIDRKIGIQKNSEYLFFLFINQSINQFINQFIYYLLGIHRCSTDTSTLKLGLKL